MHASTLSHCIVMLIMHLQAFDVPPSIAWHEVNLLARTASAAALGQKPTSKRVNLQLRLAGTLRCLQAGNIALSMARL